MTDRYYFPVHAGMLTEEHRERIGKAIWEFLWCLNKTTQETIEDGERVGVVLGGKPVSYNEVVNDLGGSKSTIKRNFEKLESENYIKLERTPRGQIVRVMKSKKFFTKEERGAKTATGSKTGTLNDENRAISARGGAKTDHSNKDKKNYITTTTAEARENVQSVDTGLLPSVKKEIVSTSTAVIQCYLELRGRMFETPSDQTSALKIERAGVPADMAVKLLRQCFANFEKTKKYDTQRINSLGYCEGFIIERYEAHKQAEQEAATNAKVRPLDSLNAKTRSVNQTFRKQRKQDVNNKLLDQYWEENQ